MDFFSKQTNAIRQTRILLGYFLLAVIVITFGINIVFYVVFNSEESLTRGLSTWVSQGYWVYVSFATITIILLASLKRSWQINSNPKTIIKMVNATQIPLETNDRKQKQLVNLVEEMAIASGMPIPQIYIMQNELGLNAFVSGLQPSSAILVVTQGLLNTLNRQQLQGVIGHEFSHILNGDMRLNLRLMGVIAGILVLGQTGQFLLRGSYYRRHSHSSSFSSSSSRGKRSGGSAIMAIGLGLFIVGYAGLFFGRLIKAAISRQREFLADASAVQFTRDKSGIAGALLSIKNASQGSRLSIAAAEEMSHMCFSESNKSFISLTGWLASHPPIDDRIQAIYPGFLRLQKKQNKTQPTSAPEAIAQFSDELTSQFTSENPTYEATSEATFTSNFSSNAQPTPSAHSSPFKTVYSDAAYQVSNSVGKTTPSHLKKSMQLLDQLPQNLLEVARGEHPNQPPGNLILLLFSVANHTPFSHAKTLIGESFSVKQLEALEAMQKQLAIIDHQGKHVLFDITLARIENFDTENQQKLFSQIKKMVPSNKQSSVKGLIIYALLANKIKPEKPYKKTVSRYKKVSSALNLIFSQLLKENNYNKTKWKNAQQHQKQILTSFGVQLSDQKSRFKISFFHQSLNQLAALTPLLKKELILSVADAIQVDNEIAENELALLRLLCEYLDCPIPLSG